MKTTRLFNCYLIHWVPNSLTLACAVLSEKIEMVEFVLARDALMTKRNGKTAHELAVEKDLTDILKVLDENEF